MSKPGYAMSIELLLIIILELITDRSKDVRISVALFTQRSHALPNFGLIC